MPILDDVATVTVRDLVAQGSQMLACPSGGPENPGGARFCYACGTPLTPALAARKDRRFATALFADLVGSTALAEL